MRYYDDTRKLEGLRNEAYLWLGAPFFLNGTSRDGVGCAGLQLRLHQYTGALPEDMEIPFSSPRLSGQKNLRTMGKWLAKYPQNFEKKDQKDILPGDLISFVFEGSSREFHIATFLGDCCHRNKAFVHACPHFGVSFGDLFDCTYGTSVLDAWNILK